MSLLRSLKRTLASLVIGASPIVNSGCQLGEGFFIPGSNIYVPSVEELTNIGATNPTPVTPAQGFEEYAAIFPADRASFITHEPSDLISARDYPGILRVSSRSWNNSSTQPPLSYAAAFMHFDLSGLNSPLTVTEAKITMKLASVPYFQGAPAQSSGDFRAYLAHIEVPWSEDTLSQNWMNTLQGSFWDAARLGPNEPPREYTFSQTSPGDELVFDLTSVKLDGRINLVQNWINNPAANNGIGFIPLQTRNSPNLSRGFFDENGRSFDGNSSRLRVKFRYYIDH